MRGRVCRRVLLPGIGWAWLLTLTIAGLCGADVRRHHFEAAGIAFGVGSFVFVVLERRVTKSLSASEHPAETWTAYLIPAAAAIAACGWSLGLGPLSDDFVLYRWANSGTLVPDEWPYLRPFPLGVWSGVIALGGGWRALHSINILVHALNSFLVAALTGRWAGSRAGVAAGVVFALMPTSVEPVAWTAGIFDLMATLFVLLAANAWSRYSASWRRTAAIVLFSLAGLLSKETAIVLPALLALIATPPGSNLPNGRRSSRLWPLGLLAGGLLVLEIIWSPGLRAHLSNLPADRRQWKDVLVRPFAVLAVPISTENATSVEIYLAGVTLLVILGAALFQGAFRRTDPSPAYSRLLHALAIGAGWVLLGALPLLTRFYVAPTLEGGRFLYLPAVGFAMAISAAALSTRLAVLPGIGLTALLLLYGNGLSTQREAWRHAARARNALLDDAATIVRGGPCHTLEVLDSPDTVDGAFVFREGLPEALSRLPYDPGGVSCVARWSGLDQRLHRIEQDPRHPR